MLSLLQMERAGGYHEQSTELAKDVNGTLDKYMKT